MAKLEIHPLSELRAEAAALLAERYSRQLAAEPLLPEVGDFEAHLPAEGSVATRGGEAVAYLAKETGDLWHPSFAGHAAREPEALRDLWAAAAGASGETRFSIAVPASDAGLIDAWFRLAFGCQAVWAVREVEAADAVDFGGSIRAATDDDTEAILDFDELLYLHQQAAPSFSGLTPPQRDEVRAEVWADDAFLPFVAERDGRVVGLLGLYRRPEGDLRVPAGNVDLAFAATRPEARGGGVGLALTAHAMSWAHEHGYRSMTVDWRVVNLLSSRFWPRRGFRPQYLRLYRAVP
ncbi:MAG TPA: GNAT family N-acetyltransferase [Gaiellaceae bacterium]|nr:GNAT family N-acetyltransferase [Gaiellaceae bacterium]